MRTLFLSSRANMKIGVARIFLSTRLEKNSAGRVFTEKHVGGGFVCFRTLGLEVVSLKNALNIVKRKCNFRDVGSMEYLFK